MADVKFQVNIESRVQIQELRKLEDSLQRQIVIARATGKEYKDLETQLSGVRGQLAGFGAGDKFKSAIGAFASEIPGVGAAMNVLNGSLGMVTLGVTSVTAAIRGAVASLREFAQAQEAVAELDAVLAQTGQLTDNYRVKLQDLAGQMQDSTAIADDQWLRVLKQLTQFGADSTNIEQYAEAVKNLAGVVGSIDTASMLMSRALQGQFDMFGRYGIRVQETGTNLEKLNSLMEQVARMGGGVLEAKAQTLSGSLGGLKNATGDLMEAIGGGLDKILKLSQLIDGLKQTVQNLTSIIGGPIDKLEGLKNKIDGLAESEGNAAKRQEALATAIGKVNETLAASSKGMRDYLTQLNDVTRKTLEVIDAETELALSRVNLDLQQGKISEEEAASQRAGIASGASEQKQKALLQSNAQAQQAVETEIEAQKKAKTDLTTQRDTAAEKARITREAQQTAISDKNLLESIGDTLKRAQDERDRIAKQVRGYEEGRTIGGVPIEREAYAKAKADLEQAEEQVLALGSLYGKEYAQAVARAQAAQAALDGGGFDGKALAAREDELAKAEEALKALEKAQADSVPELEKRREALQREREQLEKLRALRVEKEQVDQTAQIDQAKAKDAANKKASEEKAAREAAEKRREAIRGEQAERDVRLADARQAEADAPDDQKRAKKLAVAKIEEEEKKRAVELAETPSEKAQAEAALKEFYTRLANDIRKIEDNAAEARARAADDAAEDERKAEIARLRLVAGTDPDKAKRIAAADAADARERQGRADRTEPAPSKTTAADVQKELDRLPSNAPARPPIPPAPAVTPPPPAKPPPAAPAQPPAAPAPAPSAPAAVPPAPRPPAATPPPATPAPAPAAPAAPARPAPSPVAAPAAAAALPPVDTRGVEGALSAAAQQIGDAFGRIEGSTSKLLAVVEKHDAKLRDIEGRVNNMRNV